MGGFSVGHHPFEPTATGSSICAYPGCLSPRGALIHMDSDGVEEIESRRGTIARLRLEADVRLRGEEAAVEQRDALASEVDRLRSRLLVVNDAAEAAERGAEQARAQRDELAGLLETTDAKAYEARQQRDAGLAEVERLRELNSALNSEVVQMTDRIGEWEDLLEQRDALAAEVARLRKELEQSRSAHAETLTKWRATIADSEAAEEQRDALADALELALPHFDSTWNGQEQRWEGGAPDEVWDAVRKALKLCGREAVLLALGRQEP